MFANQVHTQITRFNLGAYKVLYSKLYSWKEGLTGYKCSIIGISRVGGTMRFVTATELKQRATQIVTEIQSPGEEVVGRKNGKPVVLMRTVDEKEFALAPRKKEEAKHGKR